ncbi:hypothetical protein BGX21_005209 [Mortierella sp. AD011]|nr:hypothetical protein BGX21_005209 [Mortierella sp. AD011]
MPLKDRDFGQAFELISSNIHNNLRDSTSKADYHMVVSAGAPGIGKTRFGKELFSHLKDNWDTPVIKHQPRWERDNVRFHYIHLDFGNGIQLKPIDNDISDPDIIIGLRIAYCFFINGRIDMSFDVFRAKVNKDIDQFILGNVFEAIKEDQHYDNSHQLFIFLHIDEFQLLNQWDDSNTKLGGRRIMLFKNTINSLAAFMMSNSTIFVQTFLSGTAPRAIISAKETSRVSFGFVSCPLLAFKARLEIAEHFAEENGAERFEDGHFKWTLCRHFLQLLEDTGGLPRAMELLFNECFNVRKPEYFFKNINNINFEAIFANIKAGLQTRYKLYNIAQEKRLLILSLLQYSISGKPVTRATVLIPDDNKSYIENLECDNDIFLDPVIDSTTEFIIRMPFFFLCNYNDILRVVNIKLEDAFKLDRELHWQDWENFVAHFEVFRNNLLIELGTQEIKLSELYCNAKGTKDTLDTVVQLQKLSVRRAKERFPSPKLTDEHGKTIDWEKGESMIVNGQSASWGDGFLIRKNHDKKFIIMHQDKFDYKSVEYTVESALGEHIRNISGTLNAEDNLRKKLVSYEHITIIFTTQPFNDEVSDNGYLVISSNNFQDYFGPVFSSRVAFALAGAINPNFSELDRMAACLYGVGPAISKDIVAKRPYESQEDFFTKFPRVKRSIDTFETKYPGKKVKLDFYPFQ